MKLRHPARATVSTPVTSQRRRFHASSARFHPDPDRVRSAITRPLWHDDDVARLQEEIVVRGRRDDLVVVPGDPLRRAVVLLPDDDDARPGGVVTETSGKRDRIE